MSGYAVVQFVEWRDGKAVEAVPVAWLVNVGGREMCYYPRTAIKKAMKSCAAPRGDWELHAVERKTHKDILKYQKAREKEEKAMYTSAIDTEDGYATGVDTAPRDRKRMRPLRYLSDAESEGECRNVETENEPAAIAQPDQLLNSSVTQVKPTDAECRPTATRDCILNPATPMADGSTYHELVNSPFIEEEPVAAECRPTTNSNATCTASPAVLRMGAAPPPCSSDQPATPVTHGGMYQQPRTISEKLDYLIEAVDRLEAKQNRILQYLESGRSTSAEAAVEFELLPINTEDAMESLSQVVQNKTTRRQLRSYLSNIGGRDIAATTCRIMKACVTLSFASNYSLLGQRSKKCFTSLLIYRISVQAVMLSKTAAKQCDIDSYIASFLKHAPEKPGGKRYKPRKVTTNRTVATVQSLQSSDSE